MRISVIVLTCLAALGGTRVSLASPDETAGACARTASAANAACGADAIAGYSVAFGRCLNTFGAAARNACFAEARDAYAESTALCARQFDARDDLCDALGQRRYDPSFDPDDFVDPLQIGRSVRPNRFFPLVPGSEWFYRNPSEENTIDVLGKVQRIDGVPCTVVHDVVRHNGRVIEDTFDFFAQHVDGSVWYCGEQTGELEHGRVVDVSGSWRAGDEEARPGIVMQAEPHVGETYRQEFLLGEAEDAATVRTLNGTAAPPAASCARSCLVTREFTPLEPAAREDKYYAPDIGLILSIDRTTGERLPLIRYRIP